MIDMITYRERLSKHYNKNCTVDCMWGTGSYDKTKLHTSSACELGFKKGSR